jgi:hypothetical protein
MEDYYNINCHCQETRLYAKMTLMMSRTLQVTKRRETGWTSQSFNIIGGNGCRGDYHAYILTSSLSSLCNKVAIRYEGNQLARKILPNVHACMPDTLHFIFPLHRSHIHTYLCAGVTVKGLVASGGCGCIAPEEGVGVISIPTFVNTTGVDGCGPKIGLPCNSWTCSCLSRSLTSNATVVTQAYCI